MSCQTKIPLTHAWAPVENRKLLSFLHHCYKTSVETEPQISQLTTS